MDINHDRVLTLSALLTNMLASIPIFERLEILMLCAITEGIKGGGQTEDNLNKMADAFCDRMRANIPAMVAGKHIVDSASKSIN